MSHVCAATDLSMFHVGGRAELNKFEWQLQHQKFTKKKNAYITTFIPLSSHEMYGVFHTVRENGALCLSLSLFFCVFFL